MKGKKKIFLAVGILLIAASVAAVLSLRRPPDPEGPYASAWIRHRDAALRDPSLVRYYSFQEVSLSKSKVMNAAGWFGGSLELGGEEESDLNVVQGRWPWKGAIQLDRHPLQGAPINFDDNAFSVEMWFRHHGMGSLPGPNHRTMGTLLAEGNGVYEGWCLTMRYPDQILTFQIGRPKPEGPVSMAPPSPVPADAWHHVAATWDGDMMRLYVDGLLANAKSYEGDFFPASGSRFRVGFVGNGLGSVLYDLDELALYSRALSGREILTAAFFTKPPSAPVAEALNQANDAFEAGQYEAAKEIYRAIPTGDLANEELAGRIVYRIGECLREGGRLEQAYQHFAAVASDEGHPLDHRKAALTELLELRKSGASHIGNPKIFERLLESGLLSPRAAMEARLDLARAFGQFRRLEEAIAHYRSILASDRKNGLADSIRFDANLELAGILLEADQPNESVAHLESFVSKKEVPTHVQAIARLDLAKVHRDREDFASARAELEHVQSMSRVAKHLKWEAREKLKDLERLERGLPAFDPIASRTKLPGYSPAKFEFHVSPNGNDDGKGTQAAPFATLERARNAIRELRQEPEMNGARMDVVLRGGEYYFERTLTLAEQDSGTPDAPVIYRAAEGEVPILTGGKRLLDFRPVLEQGTGKRIPENVRNEVVQVNLREFGLDSFPPLEPFGFRPYGFADAAQPVVELYQDGKALTLARWPDSGWVSTGKVFDHGNPEGEAPVRFQFHDPRPLTWQDGDSVWMHGYWKHLWADYSLPIFSIDHRDYTVSSDLTPPRYGIKEGQPYYYFNIPEELDQPGEWYLDRDAATLYLYPLRDIRAADIQMSVFDGPFIRMENVSHIVLRDLTMEYSRGRALVAEDTDECRLEDSTIRNLAGQAVVVRGGTNFGVTGSEFHDIGRTPLLLFGGDRKTLSPSGHFVENCHIHHFARIDRGQTPAIRLSGVGGRVQHCLIHDAPGVAIRLEGNDHLIEFNKIHDVVRRSDDMGAVDIFNDPTYRGNIIRHNYFHDIGNEYPMGQSGVRLDGGICGTLVYGNVFENCGGGGFGAVNINGGKDNWIDRNQFVECPRAVSILPRSEQQWESYLSSEGIVSKLQKTLGLPDSPYLKKYPELQNLHGSPSVNHIWRNQVHRCGGFLIGDENDQNLFDNHVSWEMQKADNGLWENVREKVGVER